MTRKHALIIVYLIGAIVIEEAHQFFSKYLRVRISPFPFDESKISVQWYVYDLSNCISAVLLSLAILNLCNHSKLKQVALCLMGYRIAELVSFLFWNKQYGYALYLFTVGVIMFIIISKWTSKSK